MRGTEAKRIVTLADQFGPHERQIELALDYASAHPEEIEARILSDDRALEPAAAPR